MTHGRILLIIAALHSASSSSLGDAPPQPAAAAERWHVAPNIDVKYALVTPDPFDPAAEYPALLALPPGAQSEAMVEAGLQLYWEAEATKRGWVVVSPVAPESAGRAGFNGDAISTLPLLMLEVSKKVKVEGGKFHLAGVSNGGKSAFAAAIEHPELYASLLVLPGFPSEPDDRATLDRLKNLRVAMYAGERDPTWRTQAERTHKLLTSLGVDVETKILEGQEHQLELSGETLFNWLDARRPAKKNESPAAADTAGGGGSMPNTGEPAPAMDRDAETSAINAVLSDLHDAASNADGPRYFALYADDAVFLGTDAAERWTVAEFRDYAMKRFDTGKGWTYRATERHIFLGPSGDTAWFDERLTSEKYGECRGTGALVNRGGRWLITQYNLLVPVPNELLPAVADLIREHHAKQGAAADPPAK